MVTIGVVDRRLSVNANVVTRFVGEEMILLDTVSGNYFSLNAVGARVWEMAKSGLTSHAISHCLVAEFEVDHDTAAFDVQLLKGKLCSLGLSPFRE